MLNNYYLKSNIDNKINDRYDKNHIDNNYYNKDYIDILSNNVYNKTEKNDKISKLDRNIVLFNQNLINFIDKTYKNDKEILELDIKNNKTKFDKFVINTFSVFSNNISNMNNNQNGRLTDLENKNLSDTQIIKLNQLENIDLGKINKYSYYIKEFFYII